MIIRASDAKSWVKCVRRVWLDNHPPQGHENKLPNPFDQLIIDLGLQLEIKIKNDLLKKCQVVEATSEKHTRELMFSGVPIIYQGVFVLNGIIGKPDFLIKTESDKYQAADAKLAHTADKKEIQIQLGIYRQLLGNGLPALAYLSTGEITEVGDEANKEVEKYLHSMRQLLIQPEMPPVRYSDSKCKECPYLNVCKPLFEAKGEITLLYGVESRAAPGLEQQGIRNIKDLSERDVATIQDVPYLKGIEKKQRAILQAKAYLSGEYYQLASVTLPTGTYVHFDIEDNPLTLSGNKHVYLWGFLKPPYNQSSFEYVWTDHENQDKDGWVQFLKKIESYKIEYPDLILVHFSNHEKNTIKAYAERYDMHEDPTVIYLLGNQSPLFDIQDPVTDNFVLPIGAYGLKNVCKHPKLVNYQWDDDDSGSQWSVVQFANYLTSPAANTREQLKQNILKYNYNDVKATRMLECWLKQSPFT